MRQVRHAKLTQLQKHVAGLCCVLTVGVSARAWAEAPEAGTRSPVAVTRSGQATDPSLEARTQHERGILAFSDGRYADAIEAFVLADRLWPDPALSYNIARAYQQLHQDAQALSSYREYLRRAPNAHDRAVVQARIHELAERVGESELQTVMLEAEPHGATVWIDDEPVGVAPMMLRLPTGTHRVSFQHKGYRARRIDITLTPGQPPPELHTVLEADPSAAGDSDAESQAGHTNKQPARAADQAGPYERNRDEYNGRVPVLRHVGVATMLAGVGALGGALAFELMRADAARSARNETEQVKFAKALDDMQTRQTWARVFVGAGGALTALGITLLVLSRNQEHATKPKTRVALHCAPAKCRAELSGTF